MATLLTATNEALVPTGTSAQLSVGGIDVESGAVVTTLYQSNPWEFGDYRTVTNQFLWSEDMSQTAWTKLGTTATSTKLSATAGGVSHYIYQVGTNSTGYTTISGEFKAAELSWIYMAMQATTYLCFFDLANGVVGSTPQANVLNPTIEALPDGWYRCSQTMLKGSVGINYFGLATADNTSGFSGTAGDGVLYRNLQLTDSEAILPYMFSDATRGTGTTGVAKALLLTTSRTQLCLRSTMAGTGTTPDGWSVGVGTTRAGVASDYGSGDGCQAWLFTNATSINNYFTINTGSLATNSTYIFSALVESVNVTAGSNRARSFLSGAFPAGSVIEYPNCSANPAGGPLGPVQAGVLLVRVKTAGTSAASTLRIGLGISDLLTGTAQLSRPQMELGAGRTAFIPSTTAQVTVADYSYTDSGAVTLGVTATGTYDWTGTGYYQEAVPGTPVSAHRIFTMIFENAIGRRI